MGSIIMYCPFEFKEKALNGIKNIEGNVISRIYSNNEIKERLQTSVSYTHLTLPTKLEV